MSSIDEDKEIWTVFHDIRWLEVQLNEKMRAGDKDLFFGFIKESNLLSGIARDFALSRTTYSPVINNLPLL